MIKIGDRVELEWNNGSAKWRIKSLDIDPETGQRDKFDLTSLVLFDAEFSLWGEGGRKRGTVFGNFYLYALVDGDVIDGRDIYFKTAEGEFRYIDTDEVVEGIENEIFFTVENGMFKATIPN